MTGRTLICAIVFGTTPWLIGCSEPRAMQRTGDSWRVGMIMDQAPVPDRSEWYQKVQIPCGADNCGKNPEALR